MFDAFFDSYAKESKQNGPQKNLPGLILLGIFGIVWLKRSALFGILSQTIVQIPIYLALRIWNDKF